MKIRSMDTDQEIERKTVSEIHQEILYKMTPEQKLEQAGVLYAIAWELKASGIRAQNPDWSEKQVQDAVRRIFLHPQNRRRRKMRGQKRKQFPQRPRSQCRQRVVPPCARHFLQCSQVRTETHVHR